MLNPHLVNDESLTARPSILNLNREGASFLKYCVLERQGQKILVPIRYSIRNQKRQDLNSTISSDILMERNGEANYEPSEMESLFSMSAQAQQTAMLLRSKLAPKVKVEDIAQVIQIYKEFGIVKVREEAKSKFSGAELVAVNMLPKSMEKQNSVKLVRDLLRRVREQARSKNKPSPLLLFAEGERQTKKWIVSQNL